MSPAGFPRLPGIQSDQRLVDLAREGDERAFEILVRRYSRPLLRYCRQMGLSDSRAEDVVQQALVRAWLALSRGVEVHAAKAWLYRTVHNTAVNALRSARDHDPLEDRAPLELAASAESDFERRVAMRQALSDVAELPDMQREAILLTAIHGRSHEEIASTLGVTHGAVRGLLYRARATLRDAAAAAVVPQPALLWASGLLSRISPTAGGLADLSAPGGNSDIGGMLAKGAALAATAAMLAVGSGVVPLPRHLAHRSKAAAIALGIAPATAEAQASSSSTTSTSVRALGETAIASHSGPSQHRRGSGSSRRSSKLTSGRPEEGADGPDRRLLRAQPSPLSESGRSPNDGGSGGKDGLGNAPSEPTRSPSVGSQTAGSSPSDPSHHGRALSECDHCAESSTGSGGDRAASQATADAEPTQVIPASTSEPIVH